MAKCIGAKTSILFFSLAIVFLLETELAYADNIKRPYAVSTTLSNSLGIGTFVSGYTHSPMLNSSLSLEPEYTLPTDAYFPLVLAASIDISWWWLPSFHTTVFEANNRVTLSDLSITLVSPKLGNFKEVGISITPFFDVAFPTSMSSIALQRIVGVALGAGFSYGARGFSVTYSPVLSAWIYGSSSMTAPCSEVGHLDSLPPVVNAQNADFDMDRYLQRLSLGPVKEIPGTGLCQVSGRQGLGVIKNALKFGWSKKEHSISASLNWYVKFLRALVDRPELRGMHASNRNFLDATLGKIAYTYQIPVDFDLSISVGLMSYQSTFDKQGNLNFPFFDFFTPGKNQTEVFLKMTAGI